MRYLSLIRPIFINSKVYLNNFPKFSSYFSSSSSLKNPLISKKLCLVNHSYSSHINPINKNGKSLLFRRYTNEIKDSKETKSEQAPKKMSKFKQFYTQYGPTFLIIHMITVVLWIYGFFLISKQ